MTAEDCRSWLRARPPGVRRLVVTRQLRTCSPSYPCLHPLPYLFPFISRLTFKWLTPLALLQTSLSRSSSSCWVRLISAAALSTPSFRPHACSCWNSILCSNYTRPCAFHTRSLTLLYRRGRRREIVNSLAIREFTPFSSLSPLLMEVRVRPRYQTNSKQTRSLQLELLS